MKALTRSLKYEALDCAVAMVLGYRLTTLSDHLKSEAAAKGLSSQELVEHLQGLVDMPCVVDGDAPPQRVPLYSFGKPDLRALIEHSGISTSRAGEIWTAVGRLAQVTGSTEREAALRCLVFQSLGPEIDLPRFLLEGPVVDRAIVVPRREHAPAFA